MRALHSALATIEQAPDVVVNVDADVSVPRHYFEKLLHAFADDEHLGIASGSAYELRNGDWAQRHVTGDNVWGATRAYRWQCLQQIMPLEERFGWDGIDVVMAHARGWRTRTLLDLPFRHHRVEGIRDSGRLQRWAGVGRTAYYMGYRVPYLLARTMFQARNDPAAVAILWGFGAAAIRRERRLADEPARKLLREGQRLRTIARRRREARGHRPG